MTQIVAGRYAIQSILAQGSMTTVYLAQDQLLERAVALKVLHEELHSDPELRQRFDREARIGATFTHAHIARVYDVGEDPALGPFFVQEYLIGQQLDGLLPVVPTNALRWGQQLASALTVIHEHDLVHCAVTPHNIQITTDGRAVLFDFGLVARQSVSLHPGTGTPHYMAPELALGESPTPAVDVYALGVILYEMLTGQIPLYSTPALQQPAWQQVSTVPALRTTLPTIVSAVETILGRATAIDPAQRPAMSELNTTLKELIGAANRETTVIGRPTSRLTLTLPDLRPDLIAPQHSRLGDPHEAPTVTINPQTRQLMIDAQTLPTQVIGHYSADTRPPGSRQMPIVPAQVVQAAPTAAPIAHPARSEPIWQRIIQVGSARLRLVAGQPKAWWRSRQIQALLLAGLAFVLIGLGLTSRRPAPAQPGPSLAVAPTPTRFQIWAPPPQAPPHMTYLPLAMK